ncbi:MAG: hypothetical protein FJY75_05535, partial [Candidatus Eisenbacteria bacterium]|nr:hypothetical protein [Candidatus Eisenbacteria bacterium]
SETRRQIVSLIEPRFASDGGPELVDECFSIQTSDPEGLAYQIHSGRLTDVVAFRPYDSTENWWIYPQGYAPIEAEQATLVAVRFDGSEFSDGSVRAGLLCGRGELRFDGHLVAALSGDRASSLSFSETGVSCWVDGTVAPEYFVDLTPPAAPSDPTDRSLPEPKAAIRSGAFWLRRIPSPLRAGDRIEWSGLGGPVGIGVYDTSGRLLRSIRGSAPHGDLSFIWDGRASDGRAIPTGLYLLRVRQGESAWGRSVIVLR